MRVTIGAVTPRKHRLKSGPAHELFCDYVKRASRFMPTESQFFDSEAALLETLVRAPGRMPAHLVLLDSRGKSLDSIGIAEHVRRIRDAGAQQMLFVIGPPDGWSATALPRADLLLSLGIITLPHELALVVLAEQVYRAQTILARHPYHCEHQ